MTSVLKWFWFDFHYIRWDIGFFRKYSEHVVHHYGHDCYCGDIDGDDDIDDDDDDDDDDDHDYGNEDEHEDDYGDGDYLDGDCRDDGFSGFWCR